MGRRSILERGVAVGAIGVLALAVGTIGIATAANGGSLTLGQKNTTTKTTTLSDRKGTPLSLKAKHGHAPLKVNSSTLVKKLNAAELDGNSASQLRVSGSSATLPDDLTSSSPTLVPLLDATAGTGTETLHPQPIVATAELAAGTYEVTATAGAEDAVCWINTNASQAAQNYGLAGSEGTTAETQSLHVAAHQRAVEYCAALRTGSPTSEGGVVLTAGITAIEAGTNTPGVVQATPVPVPSPSESALVRP